MATGLQGSIYHSRISRWDLGWSFSSGMSSASVSLSFHGCEHCLITVVVKNKWTVLCPSLKCLLSHLAGQWNGWRLYCCKLIKIKNLVGYSLWDCKESDMTEHLVGLDSFYLGHGSMPFAPSHLLCGPAFGLGRGPWNCGSSSQLSSYPTLGTTSIYKLRSTLVSLECGQPQRRGGSMLWHLNLTLEVVGSTSRVLNREHTSSDML